MMFLRSPHKLLVLMMALAISGLASAQTTTGRQPGTSSDEAKNGDVRVSTPESYPADKKTGSELILVGVPVDLSVATGGNEPALIHYKSSVNRFVGDVDMERFLRPGVNNRKNSGAARGSQRNQWLPRTFSVLGVSDTDVLASEKSLHKNPVFHWTFSGMLQVSLDMIAAREIHPVASPFQSIYQAEGTPLPLESGKNPGGVGFSYTPPASSMASRPVPVSAPQLASSFSLKGYQLGLRSSMDLGGNSTLGFDFGLGQALSRDLGSDASKRLTVTSLGIGLGSKRFRASVKSDVFMDDQGVRLGEQSTVGVQFDWKFDDAATLSVGARRPLQDNGTQVERDFSSTIPYIRYQKDL